MNENPDSHQHVQILKCILKLKMHIKHIGYMDTCIQSIGRIQIKINVLCRSDFKIIPRMLGEFDAIKVCQTELDYFFRASYFSKKDF